MKPRAAALGITAALLILTVNAAAAAAATWGDVAAPLPTGTTVSQLGGVSCSSLTACTAVGAAVDPSAAPPVAPLVERWDGATLARQAAPAPDGLPSSLWSVSCPTRTTCMAVGGAYATSPTSGATSYEPLAEGWTGTSWRVLPTPTPSGATSAVLTSVSCASSTACEAVGEETGTGLGVLALAFAERWDGTAWTVQQVPNPTTGGFGASDSLSSVSCPTATDCVAVGNVVNNLDVGSNSEAPPLVATFNGTSWTAQPISLPSGLNGAGYLASVSCPTAASCAAVGGTPFLFHQQPIVATFGAGTWSLTSPPVPSAAGSTVLTAVSCRATTACTVMGSINTYFSLVSPLVGLNGVTPATAPAAAGEPVAFEWNGSQVTADAPLPLPSGWYAAIGSVSCPEPATCAAVGAAGAATAASGGSTQNVLGTTTALIAASAP